MRRFERDVAGTRRFWEGDLQGSELHLHTGAVGRTGTVRVQRERTPDAAAAALARAVSMMEGSGWVEVVQAPDPSPQAEAARPPPPDDRAAALVLADRLQGDGDPRGELIAVQVALEDDPTDPTLLDRERHLLQVLRPSALPDGTDARWRRGWLHALVLAQDGWGAAAAEVLEGLASGGELDGLGRLRTTGSGSPDPIAMALARRSWPSLGHLDLAGTLSVPLGRVVAGMPALTALHVGRAGAVGALDAPRLERLDLGIAGTTGVDDLASAALPSLQHLALRLGGPYVDRGALGRLVARPLASLCVDQAVLDELADVLGLDTLPWGRLEIVGIDRPAELADVLPGLARVLDGVDVRLRGEVPDLELQAIRAVLPVRTDLPDLRRPPDLVQLSARQESTRRFERTRAGSTRFWEITREGADLVVRHGLVGRPGSVRRTPLPDPESAAGAWRSRVRARLAEGWTPVEPPRVTAPEEDG